MSSGKKFFRWDSKFKGKRKTLAIGQYPEIGLKEARAQAFQLKTSKKVVLRPKQERLMQLLRDHGSMSPAELWVALGISRQGAMDLLHPLLEAGLVEKIGSKKTGRYVLRNQ